MFFFFLLFRCFYAYDTTLQLDPNPRLLSLVLQPNPLKLGSCKFNVVINIINITLRSGVAAKPKTLGYSFAERPNTFRS